MQVPTHIAIIMDGNGRWAAARGKVRTAGHKEGAETLKTIVSAAARMGVGYLTVYAFSTENWNRSAVEVKFIMNLIREYMKIARDMAMENDIRVRVIGDRGPLSDALLSEIEFTEEETGKNSGMLFTIAINYGSRDEMIRAMRAMARDHVEPEAITPELFADYLDTKGMPDPDLMIRTSGEYRLSNYLLWQTAYSEFYFTDTYWPDFSVEELEKAIGQYQKRDRRFGGVK